MYCHNRSTTCKYWVDYVKLGWWELNWNSLIEIGTTNYLLEELGTNSTLQELVLGINGLILLMIREH